MKPVSIGARLITVSPAPPLVKSPSTFCVSNLLTYLFMQNPASCLITGVIEIVPIGDCGHHLTLTLTSDDLESHIVVNVSSILTNTTSWFVVALSLTVDVTDTQAIEVALFCGFLFRKVL